MSKLAKTHKLVQAAGKGLLSIGKIWKPGQYQSKAANRIWGFPPLLVLPTIAALCFAVSYFVPWGLHAGNPFSMRFPFQAPSMAIGLIFSPLTLFALFCGWTLKKAIKNGQLLSHDIQNGWANLGLPVIISGLLLVVLYQFFLSYRFLQDGITLHSLVHSFGNILFLSAWLSFFIASAVINTGHGIGKMMSGFFSYHAFLFSQSFIPSFGVLDFIANNFLSLDYGNSSWQILIASTVKAVISIGVIGIFWILLQEKLNTLTSVKTDELPPIPADVQVKLPPLPNQSDVPEK